MRKTIFLCFSFCLLIMMSCQPVTNENKKQETTVAVPNITVQPKSDNVYFANNQTFKLSVTAEVSDGGTLTFQWYKNGEAIKGAVESTYSEKVNVETNETAEYYCEITNTLNSKTASAKTDTVKLHFIAGFVSGTDKYTLQIGKTQQIDISNVTFTLTWKSSDEKVATVKDGLVTAVAEGEATVTASFGEISKSWKIIVNSKINASTPTYSFMYGSQNITENKKLSFIKQGKLKVDASVTDSNGTLTYKWSFNGNFADASSAEITVSEPGEYFCVITNTITGDNIGEPTASISTPKLTVEVEKPVISGFVYGTNAVTNNKASAKAGASLKPQVSISDNAGDLTYKWFKENTLITNANNESFQVTEYGNYYCVVTNQIAGEKYCIDVKSATIEITENKISFQEIIDRTEKSSSTSLTISDTSISYGEEKIDLGNDFGSTIFTGGNAQVNKTLTISSSSNTKLLENSDLLANADGIKLAGLTLNKVEATASLGNGSLTIADSKLNSLLLNGGGYNSIHLEGTNNVENVSFGKVDTKEYTRLSIENGSTKIAKLSATSSGMIQGDVTVDTVEYGNWNEASINLAMQISAKINVPDSENIVEVFFGQKNNASSDNYEPKFKILLNEGVILNRNFLNQAGTKLWGDDFYGYTWINVDSTSDNLDSAKLTTEPIGKAIPNSGKIRLACDAKEKAILLPHIEPTYKYISRDGGNNFTQAVKQFHLTHYSKLYASLNDNTNKIDINDPEKVELKTTLLDYSNDGNWYIELAGYENAFSVVHDSYRNVYATIACGNITSDNNLTRYGHFYVKMLKEEDITKNLKNGEIADVTMEKKFELPDYLTDLSYLGDAISEYAAVNSPVESFNAAANVSFNNNFIASFARLAVDTDGTKLYLLTGAYGKDKVGNTYKLCVYDLTNTGSMLMPTEVNITWKSVPQAIALSEDGTKLYVAEIKYNDDYSPDPYTSYSSINVYEISGTSASYSSQLLSYNDLPYTAYIGTSNTSYYGDKMFGKMRIGVSDMKTGNGCLYITNENVNLHAYLGNSFGKISKGALTIVDLASGNIIKDRIGFKDEGSFPENEYNGFYGPARILAVEPKKIIILDDGNSNEDESWMFSLIPNASGYWTENFLKQKNRVAVYDLANDTLKFANMGSEFGLYSTRHSGSF